MGWLKMFWGEGRPPDRAPKVSKTEFERTKLEYDRKLRELEAAMHALRGDEPDHRYPHAD